VRLAQTDATMDEERVELSTGIVRHGEGGGIAWATRCTSTHAAPAAGACTANHLPSVNLLNGSQP